MNMPPNLGLLLLPIWLIAYGVITMPVLGMGSTGTHNLLGIFAIVVGVVLLSKR